MKVIHNLIKYKDILLSISLFLLISSFFFVHAERSFDGTTRRMKEAEVVKFKTSDKITQKFRVDKNIRLTKISIQFGTYAKKNKGTLSVTLFENDTIIDQWKVGTAGMEDNGYQTLVLKEPYEVHAERAYSIELSDDFKGDNAVAVWLSSENGGLCYLNGSYLYGKTICYQLNFKDMAAKRCVVAAAFIIAFLLGVLILLQIDERVIMSVLFIILGCVYMWLCTPGMAPDEDNHFRRAFEISCGNLVSKGLYGGTIGGNYLPAEVDDFMDPDKELDWGNKEMFTFSNTALYAPVSYLPHSIGIRIVRCFTNNVSKIFYGGKFGNFLVSTALCLWALYRIPFGRKILFMIMTFPMTMQEMVSMSTDGFTTSLCLAFTAYVLYVCYDTNDKMRKRDIFIIAALSILISLCKIVYIVLVLLIFLIPNEKIGGRKAWANFKFGISGAAMLFNLIWLKMCSGFLMEFQPGVNAGKQVQYVLTNIDKFYVVVIQSIIEYGNHWIQTMFGSYMGALNIEIAPFVWVVFLIFFLYEICNYKRLEVKPHKFDQLIMFLIFLGGTGLIFTSLYVQWTPFKSEIIEGIQGRYFIPLIIFPAFLVMYSNDKKKKDVRYIVSHSERGMYYYMLLLVLNGITILEIIQYTLSG